MNLSRHNYFFIGFGLSILSFSFSFDLQSQSLNSSSSGKKGDLIQFSKKRNDAWNQNYQKAVKLSEELQFPTSYTDERGRMVMLQRLGHQNRPVYYATDNRPFIVGTAITTRDIAGEAGNSIFGPLFNLVPISLAYSGEKSCKMWIKEVSHKLRSANKHKLFKINKLINKLGTKKEEGRHPLFNVLFIWHEDVDNKKEWKQS